MNLRLNPDERGAIIGQTGTGKSKLARELLPGKTALAIIDPKRGFEYEGIKVFDSAAKIAKDKPKRFIYSPHPDEPMILGLNVVYKHLFEMGNVFVYTDDPATEIRPQRYPHYWAKIYQMGRSRNIAGLTSMQRPSNLPKFLLSEVQAYFAFRLNTKGDIDRVSEFLPGYNPDRLEDKHTFLYYHTYGELDSGIPLRLRFEGKEKL